MAKANYILIAGVERPDSIDVGTLEKGAGQGTITGKTEKIVPARGQVAVPNSTEAWGIRVLEEGKKPEKAVDVRDKEYKGQIMTMEWGTEGGYVIPCRYLKGYNSIDKQYQDIVLGAKEFVESTRDTVQSAEIDYLWLLSGMNIYDPESDKYLIQMFRVHCLNKSNKSKSPDYDQWWMEEYSIAEEGLRVEKKLDLKFEALKIVNEASSDNTFAKLKNLFTVVKNISDGTPKEVDTYKHLQKLADSMPEEFLAQVAEYKKKVSNIFEKAKSFKVIDLTKDGVIAAGDVKKEVLGSDIPGKKDGMIDWILENYLDDKSWSIVYQLETITSKL